MVPSFSEEEFATLQEVAGRLPPNKQATFLLLAQQYMAQHGAYDPAVDVVELAIEAALRYVTQMAAGTQNARII
jgi:hypothetical protein